MVILVSDCLLGKNCRYKGDNRYSEKVADFIKGHTVIGVCPEQAGGLPTPRCPAERVNGKVINSEGKDVTKEYLSGARAALDLAKKNSVDICIMKAGSPSCGCGYIYDGTFTGKHISGDGVTSELLKKNGFKVITENDL